jgi:hypothetical protein
MDGEHGEPVEFQAPDPNVDTANYVAFCAAFASAASELFGVEPHEIEIQMPITGTQYRVQENGKYAGVLMLEGM